ncbi:hypothetical protein GGR56DRAFT_177304 [Xylariaceae sp. FL0804]|nr:hypothetical protein GGR56DRAFT_177304 [Xylariaceae sp. FL0804]
MISHMSSLGTVLKDEGETPPRMMEHVSSGPRKKFAQPPVKIACLSCRASRTRCNGENPCASCVAKARQCAYKPSRRGGPRIRKKPRPLPDLQDYAAASLKTKEEEIPQDPLLLDNYINPGAGLKALADVWEDSDAIYDNLFQAPLAAVDPNLEGPTARSYGNDEHAILNAYYVWIHPYFSILPPPEHAPVADQPMLLLERQKEDLEEPKSPFALAISAILALIPTSSDPDPFRPESVLWRRTYAQFLAKSALESIESESELPESSVEPPRALDEDGGEIYREKFHPRVPLELEGIIALNLLSVYEYAQRGNLKKMKARAGSALVAAMSLSIHTQNDVEDEYSEARRRVWWTTWACVCQASIVSNTPPTFEVFTSSFTAKYPTIRADPEAWPIFIQAQQAILASTKFVIEFNKTRKAGADLSHVFHRMWELERLLEPLVTRSEAWNLKCPLTQPVDRSEAVLGQSLRCMARIKLNSARIKVHRYCAFFDIAVFSTKHCDLASTSRRDDADGSRPRQLQACCVIAPDSNPPSLRGGRSDGRPPLSPELSDSSPSSASYSDDAPSSSTATATTTPSLSLPPQLQLHPAPFSTHYSSRVCLQSALNIASGFDALPYPNPSGRPSDAPLYLGPRSILITPRMMPSFACCAMQCSYALLMVRGRIESSLSSSSSLLSSSSSLSPGNNNPLAENMRNHIQQGLLSMLATLENYGSTFEALGGMRDQIRDKVDMPPSLGAYFS